MEIEVKTVKYIKQEDSPKTLTLPDVKSFYFQTGIRRSIALIPEWTSWKTDQGLPEELYSYTIISVYQNFECRIERDNIAVHRIQDIYNGTGHLHDLLLFLVGHESNRSEEQFMKDFNHALAEFNGILNKNEDE